MDALFVPVRLGIIVVEAIKQTCTEGIHKVPLYCAILVELFALVVQPKSLDLVIEAESQNADAKTNNLPALWKFSQSPNSWQSRKRIPLMKMKKISLSKSLLSSSQIFTLRSVTIVLRIPVDVFDRLDIIQFVRTLGSDPEGIALGESK
jgi:hypothetical protein